MLSVRNVMAFAYALNQTPTIGIQIFSIKINKNDKENSF